MPATGTHNFRYFSNQRGEGRGEEQLEKKRRNPHRCKEANTCKSRDPYSGHDSNGSTENTWRIIRNCYAIPLLLLISVSIYDSSLLSLSFSVPLSPSSFLFLPPSRPLPPPAPITFHAKRAITSTTLA